MKTTRFAVFFATLLSLLFLWSQLCSSYPTTFNYQGRMTDQNGVPVPDGNYQMQFDLYSTNSGGTSLWTQNEDVLVVNGIYNMKLGTGGAPLTSDLFSTDYIYLEVRIYNHGTSSWETMTPRQQLVSSPYSMRAVIADSVIDDSINSAKIEDGTITDDDLGPIIDADTLNGRNFAEILAEETDPTVPPEYKDGISWNEIFDIPDDFTDGVDNNSGGDITSVRTATLSGLLGGSDDGDVDLQVNFAGTGNLDTVARSDHAHDNRYYREDELRNPGTGADVHWDNIISTPYIGDITGVAAGDGLNGGGVSSDVTLNVAFAGTGGSTSVARSDHNHDEDYYSKQYVNDLEDRIETAEERIDELVALLIHMTIVQGELNGMPGPHMIIEGANLHVQSGSEATDGEVNGLGNLVVGYNEEAPAALTIPMCSLSEYDNEGDCIIGGGTWKSNHRSGSHNLVIGSLHSFSSYGGLLAGKNNLVNSVFSSVIGGEYNHARGHISAIMGGTFNSASGSLSSISGGDSNTASGVRSSVSGGVENTASGTGSSVSGGSTRSATGTYDWRAGGYFQDQ